MKHIIENKDLESDLIVDETLCENTSITLLQGVESLTHYLTPNDLKNLIGVLLHIQAKKRKNKNFDNLSNTF